MKNAAAWIAIAVGLALGTTTGGNAQTLGDRAREKAHSAGAAEAVQNERDRRTLGRAAAESLEKTRSAAVAEAVQKERERRTPVRAAAKSVETAEGSEIARPSRTRSLTRIWTGIAIAAAGAATALTGRTCRSTGSLPRTSILPYHHGQMTTSMTDLYAYETGGECGIDFQIHVRVDDPAAASPSYQESHLYSELHYYTRQGLPENLAGTARAETGLDRGRLYSGIAAAAAGIALATIFADIPVAVTEMSPSRITVGSGISW